MSSVYADLHTHTTASDGLNPPLELIKLARGAGLMAIAICDHDTVAGLAEILRNPPKDLVIVPAIEMSANVGHDEVHVLGYFIDPQSPALTAALAWFQEQRIVRVKRFCQRLTDIGLPLTFAEVEAQATGESIGRPHIARAMIARGYVHSVNDAFDQYLSGGKPGFVPRDEITPEQCIDLIHQSGGAASLAHPYTVSDPEAMIQRLVPVGLDALEVEYGAYAESDRAPLRVLANRYHLVHTGGSDFHGSSHRENAPLGSGGISTDGLDQLCRTGEKYRVKRP